MDAPCIMLFTYFSIVYILYVGGRSCIMLFTYLRVCGILYVQAEATCILRKGLPRAFPGLEEVNGESIKEGLQYKSRVFVAPRELVHGK